MFDSDLIYLDNHATTRCDPRVVEAMLPLWSENYGNMHSTSHTAGRMAAEAVERAMLTMAQLLHCEADEIIITSGATESNNLAINGVCLHPRQKRRGIVTLETEHSAILDPTGALCSSDHPFQVTRLPVEKQGSLQCGQVDLNLLEETVDDNTAIVSVMLANNEIGVLQQLRQIADLCHERGALLHTDATQAVGKIPVDVDQLNVDLLSASAHKFYGPKGIGLLFVRRRGRRVRLRPSIVGGGQQHGIRGGTVNTAGVVGMSQALQISASDGASDNRKIDCLARRLWESIKSGIPNCQLNGPARDPALRLAGNLNICFPGIEGETLMSACPTLAISSGSACSSVDPRPSHVLLGIGLSESEARRSLRFGIGRFNTESEIDQAVSLLLAAHARYAE